MKKRKKSRSDAPIPFMLCMRAAVFACIGTVVFVFILAFLLKWDVLKTDSIRVFNTAIKSICACLAGFLCARTIQQRGWLYGALSGGLYMTIAYVIFFFFEREFRLDIVFFSDLLLGLVCGGGIGTIYALVRNMRAQS